MEAESDNPTPRAKAKPARYTALCAVLAAATITLIATWNEHGSAVMRESRQARQEFKKAARQVSKPIRNFWRDVKRGWRNL